MLSHRQTVLRFYREARWSISSFWWQCTRLYAFNAAAAAADAYHDNRYWLTALSLCRKLHLGVTCCRIPFSVLTLLNWYSHTVCIQSFSNDCKKFTFGEIGVRVRKSSRKMSQMIHLLKDDNSVFTLYTVTYLKSITINNNSNTGNNYSVFHV